jgi:protein phosphatase 4 regulatory subunit 3
LKYFRTCIGLQDEFYYDQMREHRVFGPILDIVLQTMHRDNLLNSACLEMFEFVKREGIKPVINHLVESYKGRLEQISCVDIFGHLIQRHEVIMGYDPSLEGTLFDRDEDGPPPKNRVNGHHRWQGAREMDATEEEYFDTSDDEDDLGAKAKAAPPLTNGVSTQTKPLVDYPDDEEEATDSRLKPFYDEMPAEPKGGKQFPASPPGAAMPLSQNPPERLSEKRRREEDEEDELGKLTLAKRRSASTSPAASANSHSSNPGSQIRRRKSFVPTRESHVGGKKIAISLAVKSPIEAEQASGEKG